MSSAGDLKNLYTSRLRLRPFAEGDFDALYEINTNVDFVRYEHPLLSSEQVQERLERALAERNENPRIHHRFAVVIPPSSEFRGYVSLTLIQNNIREFEIGWSIHPNEWGKGYATEAARRLLQYAFSDLNAHRVVAYCHAQNVASERVMQKLGMKKEGIIREVRWLNGAFWDELVYAILDREFANF